MDKYLKSLIVAAMIMVTNGASLGAAELLSTHPSHYGLSGTGLQGGGTSRLDRTKQVRSGSRVIVREDGALRERWYLNPDLSRACNRRVFRQKRDQLFIGVVEGHTYGAAVGGHSSLLDRAGLAENQAIYLFRGQGTTNCRVYHRTK